MSRPECLHKTCPAKNMFLFIHAKSIYLASDIHTFFQKVGRAIKQIVPAKAPAFQPIANGRVGEGSSPPFLE